MVALRVHGICRVEMLSPVLTIYHSVVVVLARSLSAHRRGGCTQFRWRRDGFNTKCHVSSGIALAAIAAAAAANVGVSTATATATAFWRSVNFVPVEPWRVVRPCVRQI